MQSHMEGRVNTPIVLEDRDTLSTQLCSRLFSTVFAFYCSVS
jgi:hypothetical protein